MKKIKLTQGKFALVDDEDFEELNKYKWHYNEDTKGQGAAVRWTVTDDYKQKKLRMHRVIMNAQKGQLVDHRFGDTLDNRKNNLRLCTNSQNMANRGLPTNNTSGVKGVWLSKAQGKWVANIEVQGIKKTLGTFDSKIDAARAYNKAALKYFGDFARVNEVLK